jgi:hypothetical protein
MYPIVKKINAFFLSFLMINLAFVKPSLAADLSIQQLMSLFSTLEGYSFIFKGLDENGVNLDSLATDPITLSYSFSESGASLTSSGTINEQAFSLNYSGTLSGDYPNENTSWIGTWSGYLGSSTIAATDTGTFSFNSSLGGYDQFDFRQSGSLDDGLGEVSATLSKGWKVAGLEAIGGGILGGLATCWTGIGCFGGIFGGASFALAVSGVVATIDGSEPDTKPKPPLDDPDPDHKTEVGGDGKGTTVIEIGKGGKVKITTDQPCTIEQTKCPGGGSVTKITIPEYSSPLSLLSLGILGAGVTLKRKVKRSHSTEKEPTNVG